MQDPIIEETILKETVKTLVNENSMQERKLEHLFNEHKKLEERVEKMEAMIKGMLL